MGRKEELLNSIGRVKEAIGGKIGGKDIHPSKPIDKEEAIAAVIRRWFKGDVDDPQTVRSRIKELTSKSDRSRDIGMEHLKSKQYLTMQPEFADILDKAQMTKLIDSVPLLSWIPKDELQSPLLQEAAARIAALPDPEDPALLWDQLGIMYRSANFSKMSDGEIRSFRRFVNATKDQIYQSAGDPKYNFRATENDDLESPWRKKVDIYRSRRLPEPEVNQTNDAVITARNARRESFDVFLKDMQEQLEVEDPKKEGKALIELRKKVENHIVADNSSQTEKLAGRHREKVFNQSEAEEYIGIINKRLETFNGEERWTPISEEAPFAAAPAGTPAIERGGYGKLFDADPDIVARLTPEVRAYYQKVKDYLTNAPNKEVNQGTLNQFLQQMEMLSRSRDPVGGRSPESDAALKELFGVIEHRINSEELKIPTSIYLDIGEVRDILDDFPGWAEDYMREIEYLIATGGTDNPALRPVMDRFNLAQEFYGGKFFQRNLISGDIPPEESSRLEAFFSQNYEARVHVMDQYRVRLLHAEIENQLSFVRDWDMTKPDMQRIRGMIEQLGDPGMIGMRGYYGQMNDIVAKDYLLPTMNEIIYPLDTGEPVRWTPEVAEKIVKSTAEKVKTDKAAFNKSYEQYMMDLRWQAKGRAFVEADLAVENQVRTSGVVLTPEQKEQRKRMRFEEIVKKKKLRFGSLDDEDGDKTIEAIVRNAFSSARLQFQVKEKVAVSLGPRETATETNYSAFVFTTWEERLLKDRFWSTHKMRWGAVDSEKAMWKQGNMYLLSEDKGLHEYAQHVADDKWKSFNDWWGEVHKKIPGNVKTEEFLKTLNDFKKYEDSTKPKEQKLYGLYDRYVHFVEQFWSYQRANELGSPVTQTSKQTFEFFEDLHRDKLRGKKKFTGQIMSNVANIWQEEHTTRAYNHWKSGERTTAVMDELKSIFREKGWKELDVGEYYFRGRTLFGKARDYFFPCQYDRSHESYKKLFDEIHNHQAGYHPLEFIRLERLVEGYPDLDLKEYQEAERRFHTIQGILIAKTKEDQGYKPIDYLHGLTSKQDEVVNMVFDKVKVNGDDYKLTKERYLEVMKKYGKRVKGKAHDYTHLKYANLLGREILYYDDLPEGIIDPDHMATAYNKGASNLFARAWVDQIFALNVADMTNTSLTLDMKTLHEVANQIDTQVTGYSGSVDGAVAKALVYARYTGYTRGRVDLADAVLRNKMLNSEAQEIGKYPGAPANSPIELEHILGEGQKSNRIENLSPAFGEALESFAGVSSWNKVTGGTGGLLAKVLHERRYHQVMRYLNDRIPTNIMLVRLRNTALFFGITTGLFIGKQVESGGEEQKKE